MPPFLSFAFFRGASLPRLYEAVATKAFRRGYISDLAPAVCVFDAWGLQAVSAAGIAAAFPAPLQLAVPRKPSRHSLETGALSAARSSQAEIKSADGVRKIFSRPPSGS